jgi:ribonucleoside-triphosphate reductase (formate)
MKKKNEPLLKYYPKEFADLMNKIFSKYNNKYLTTLGLGDWLNPHFYSKNFFKRENPDVTIDVNANASNNTMQNYLSEFGKAHVFLNNLYLIYKTVERGSCLNNKKKGYINKIFKHIFNGDIYIHDKHHFGQLPYCYAYDCIDWVINGIPKEISPTAISKPAKHFDSFLQHTENLIIYFSNSSSGAAALPNLFPVLDWYIRNDLKSGYLNIENYKEKVKQRLQSFIFNLNQSTRNSLQSPFSNLSFLDKVFMKKLFKDIVFPDMTTYNEDTTMELQELFMEVLEENYRKVPMTFPVMTAALAKDEKNNILDEETFEKMLKIDLNRGVFNWLVSTPNKYSSCCRLSNDLESEEFVTNSFGSGGVKIGSLGVATLVLPNIALNNSNLDSVVEIAKDLLRIKRHLLEKRIKQGKLPLYTINWMRLKTQYQTVGITGLNEFLEIKFGKNILNKCSRENAKNTLENIKKIVKSNNSKNDMFNIEYVPAENAGVKMAELTKIKGLHNYNLFSNQIIPHEYNLDLYERMEIYSECSTIFSGGNILHINCDTHLTDINILRKLIKKAVEFNVDYFARNEINGTCENGHNISGIKITGNEPKCPICEGKFIEYRDRIVGYQVALTSFSQVRLLHDFNKRYRHKIK